MGFQHTTDTIYIHFYQTELRQSVYNCSMICTPICGKIGFHGNREWMLSADGSAAAVMVEAYNSISSKITTSSIILYTTTRFTLVANYCHHHHSLRNEICLPL